MKTRHASSAKKKKQIDNLVYRAKATLKKILTEEGISHAQ